MAPLFKVACLLFLALLVNSTTSSPLPFLSAQPRRLDAFGRRDVYRVLKRRDGMALPAAAVIGKRQYRTFAPSSTSSSSSTSLPASTPSRNEAQSQGPSPGEAMSEADNFALEAIRAGFVPVASSNVVSGGGGNGGSSGADASNGSPSGDSGSTSSPSPNFNAGQANQQPAPAPQQQSPPQPLLRVAPSPVGETLAAPNQLTPPAAAATGTAGTVVTAAAASETAETAVGSGTQTLVGSATSPSPSTPLSTPVSTTSIPSTTSTTSPTSIPSSASAYLSPSSASPSLSSLSTSASASAAAASTQPTAFSLPAAFKSSSPYFPFAIAGLMLTILAGVLSLIWILKQLAHRSSSLSLSRSSSSASATAKTSRRNSKYPDSIPWVPRSHSEALLTPPIVPRRRMGSGGTTQREGGWEGSVWSSTVSSRGAGAGKGSKWARLTWPRGTLFGTSKAKPSLPAPGASLEEWTTFDPHSAPDARPVSIPTFSHPFAPTSSPGLRVIPVPEAAKPRSTRSSASEFGVLETAGGHPPALIPGSMMGFPERPRAGFPAPPPSAAQAQRRGSSATIDQFLRELGAEGSPAVVGREMRELGTGRVKARAGTRTATR